ncbi:hypothetical protein Pla100_03740 [Neorhodopirellula pilleata]|uniref:Uncharacterized protein n=1 Tax=Neorhodopirellula pilleata TaxID=2714738 RepID=A0A5C6AVD8_9BACT|nr:hypothetical protein Pla100_03740 [Neorhodopirellula pilleata]
MRHALFSSQPPPDPAKPKPSRLRCRRLLLNQGCSFVELHADRLAKCRVPKLPRVEPRPEQECCDEAKAAGMSDGDAGGVVCCDGRKVSCVWISTGYLIGHPDRPTEPTAIKIIDECVKKHEDTHHGHIDDCKAKVPSLERPDFSAGVDADKGECEAYKAEEKCMKGKIVKCRGRLNCANQVRQVLEILKKRRDRHCRDSLKP